MPVHLLHGRSGSKPSDLANKQTRSNRFFFSENNYITTIPRFGRCGLNSRIVVTWTWEIRDDFCYVYILFCNTYVTTEFMNCAKKLKN